MAGWLYLRYSGVIKTQPLLRMVDALTRYVESRLEVEVRWERGGKDDWCVVGRKG